MAFMSQLQHISDGWKLGESHFYPYLSPENFNWETWRQVQFPELEEHADFGVRCWQMFTSWLLVGDSFVASANFHSINSHRSWFSAIEMMSFNTELGRDASSQRSWAGRWWLQHTNGTSCTDKHRDSFFWGGGAEKAPGQHLCNPRKHVNRTFILMFQCLHPCEAWQYFWIHEWHKSLWVINVLVFKLASEDFCFL